MSFPVHDGSHATSVTTSSDHTQVSSLEFDGIHDFASVDVQPKKMWGKISKETILIFAMKISANIFLIGFWKLLFIFSRLKPNVYQIVFEIRRGSQTEFIF